MHKTILLVEDEPLIAMAEKMTLERSGYLVITANTGEKAIEIVRENREINLILMDIDLGPGISGTDAAEAILSQRDLPLAFLSSHTEQEVVEKIEGITSYGYIVKNSGNTVLLASIRMAFKLHEAHAELFRQKEHLDSALAREEHVNEELERYFSTSLDMLCIADTSGRFLRLNPEWEKVLGFPLSELEGRQFMDFVHPEDRDVTIEILEQLADQKEVKSFENRYRCRDGSYRRIEWRSRPAGSTIYAAARDITDRRNAEDALRDKEEILRNLMENSIDAVQLLDEDGCFLDINNVSCEMTGYTREELLTMRIADIAPNYPAEGFSSFWRQQSKGKSILFETIHRHKNGRLIPVEVNGIFFELNNRKLLFGVARDLTERKRVREELEQTSTYYTTLIEKAPDGVALINREGKLCYASPAAKRIFGYADETIDTLSPDELTHPDDLPRVHETVAAVISDPSHVATIEYRFQTRDGLWRWIESTFSNQLSEPGIEAIIINFRDITDRRNAEEQLRQQASLQRLLMTLAAEMIDVPLDNVDERINWMLAEVGRFNGFDRVFIFRHDFDRAVTINTHEWCAPGITSEIENLQGLPFHEIARVMDAHRVGRPFAVPRAAELPENDSIRVIMEAQGIKSTLQLPLVHEGVNIGFVGFDAVQEERSVSEPIVELLRFTARLITNTESRRAGATKQQTAEQAIRQNEERFRGLLDGIREVPVQGFGPDGTVHYWNLASQELYGYGAEEAIGRSVLDLLIPEELQPTIRERIRRMVETGEPFPATEDWIVRKDGSRVFIRTTHAVVQLPDRAVELFSIDQDVTEQRQAEEDVRRLAQEKELLLKEVQHRIKNTMNTMGSLLSLHANAVKESDAAAALNDARGRFESMEILYDQLYRTDTHTSGSFRQYLKQLVERVVDLFPAGNAVRTVIDIEDLDLDTRRLSVLGMIVNELTTNAMKYAYRGHPDPVFRVTGRLSHDPSSAPSREQYTLVIADNGPGLPESFDRSTSSSFGMTMVDALTTQLNGAIRFECAGGTHAVLEFPPERNRKR